MLKWKTKEFWQWMSILCYLGFLFWMGQEWMHRNMPNLFFAALLGATAALMIALKIIQMGIGRKN